MYSALFKHVHVIIFYFICFWLALAIFFSATFLKPADSVIPSEGSLETNTSSSLLRDQQKGFFLVSFLVCSVCGMVVMVEVWS
jgi:hypothetical protein